MSLFNVFDVAGTALNAQSIRLNTTASNLANAESVSGDPTKVYRARHPVFQSMVRYDDGFDLPDEDAASVGVKVLGVVESQGRLCLQLERQFDRRDDQHDFRVAILSNQHRRDEHRARSVVENHFDGTLRSPYAGQ
jgi:flagellar basal-body rod protein FlgC